MSFKPSLRGLLLAAALLSPGTADAAPRDKEALRQVEARIEAETKRQEDLGEAEKKAAADIASIQQKLIGAAEALQAKQKEQEQLAEKLATLEKKGEGQEERLKIEQGRLAELTTSLLELSRDPPEAQLLHSTLTQDQIHRGLLLRGLMKHIHETSEKVAADLAELKSLQKNLDRQKQAVAEVQKGLAGQKQALDRLVLRRQGALQRTAAERDTIARQVEKLASEAQDLRQLMHT